MRRLGGQAERSRYGGLAGKATGGMADWHVEEVVVLVWQRRQHGKLAELREYAGGRRRVWWLVIGRGRCHMLRLRMASRGRPCTADWRTSERYRPPGFSSTFSHANPTTPDAQFPSEMHTSRHETNDPQLQVNKLICHFTLLPVVLQQRLEMFDFASGNLAATTKTTFRDVHRLN